VAGALLITVLPAESAQTSAYRVILRSVSAVASARSFHVDITGSSGSENLEFDLEMFKNGASSGIISINGVPSKLIIVGGTAYERISPRILEQFGVSQQQASQVGSEWVFGPNDQSVGRGTNGQYSVGISFTFSLVHTLLFNAIPYVRSEGLTRIDGQQAYKLVAGDYGTFWIDSSGRGYPIRIEAKSGGSLNVTLSNWNRGVVPKVPTPAVPVSSLHFGLTT
jgi:hypothetical protein